MILTQGPCHGWKVSPGHRSRRNVTPHDIFVFSLVEDNFTKLNGPGNYTTRECGLKQMTMVSRVWKLVSRDEKSLSRPKRPGKVQAYASRLADWCPNCSQRNSPRCPMCKRKHPTFDGRCKGHPKHSPEKPKFGPKLP